MAGAACMARTKQFMSSASLEPSCLRNIEAHESGNVGRPDALASAAHVRMRAR
jgi:hypothetical protein